MLKPEFTGQFRKDYKRAITRGCNPDNKKWRVMVVSYGYAGVETETESEALSAGYRRMHLSK